MKKLILAVLLIASAFGQMWDSDYMLVRIYDPDRDGIVNGAAYCIIASNASNAILFGGLAPVSYSNISNTFGLLPTNRVADLADFIMAVSSNHGHASTNDIIALSNFVTAQTNVLHIKINGVSNFAGAINAVTALYVTNVSNTLQGYLTAGLLAGSNYSASLVSGASTYITNVSNTLQGYIISGNLDGTNYADSVVVSATNGLPEDIVAGNLDNSNHAEAINSSTAIYSTNVSNTLQDYITSGDLGNSNNALGVSNYSGNINSSTAIYATNISNVLQDYIIAGDLALSNYSDSVGAAVTNGIPENIISGNLDNSNFTISATNGINENIVAGDLNNSNHSIGVSNFAATKIADGDPLSIGLYSPSPLVTNQLATKGYIDNKVESFQKYYFLGSTPSSISGYKTMDAVSSGSNEFSITNNGTTNNHYLISFSTRSNIPATTEILAGTYDVEIVLSKAVPGTLIVKAELYVVNQAGTTLYEIDDSPFSSEITSAKIRYPLQIIVLTNHYKTLTDRLVVKIKANVSAGSPDVYIWTEGSSVGFFGGGFTSSAEVDPIALLYAEGVSNYTASNYLFRIAGDLANSNHAISVTNNLALPFLNTNGGEMAGDVDYLNNHLSNVSFIYPGSAGMVLYSEDSASYPISLQDVNNNFIGLEGGYTVIRAPNTVYFCTNSSSLIIGGAAPDVDIYGSSLDLDAGDLSLRSYGTISIYTNINLNAKDISNVGTLWLEGGNVKDVGQIDVQTINAYGGNEINFIDDVDFGGYIASNFGLIYVGGDITNARDIYVTNILSIGPSKTIRLQEGAGYILNMIGDDAEKFTINGLNSTSNIEGRVVFKNGVLLRGDSTQNIIAANSDFSIGLYSNVTVYGELNINGNMDFGGYIASNLPVPTYSNMAANKFYVDSATNVIKSYFKGLNIGNATANSTNDITIEAGECASEDATVNIVVSTAITISFASNGVGGLDTGTEASNTWYYVFVIYNTNTGAVSAVFSANSNAPTYPSGYGKRRRIGSVRNDADKNMLRFVSVGRYDCKKITYNEDKDTILKVLNNGNATSYTPINCSNLIPPTSQCADVQLISFAGSATDQYAQFYPGILTNAINGAYSVWSQENATVNTCFKLYRVLYYRVSNAALWVNVGIVAFYEEL